MHFRFSVISYGFHAKCDWCSHLFFIAMITRLHEHIYHSLILTSNLGIEDFVMMLSWEFPRFKLRRAVNCACSDNCDNLIPGCLPHIPSLQNICRAKLMVSFEVLKSLFEGRIQAQY